MIILLFERDTWDEVYAVISKNKFRTFLTMIGVGWGMFLFVILLGLVKGMRNGFDSNLKGTATNSMFIWARKTTIPYHGFQRGRSLELHMKDIEILKKKIPEINLITPRGLKHAALFYGTQSQTYQVFGDQPEIDQMFKKKIIYGRFINHEDIAQKRKVCVIGRGILEELYAKDEKVIGTSIKINDIYFKVVGIYEKSSGISFEDDNSCFIPFSMLQQLYNMGNKISWMAINVKDKYNVKEIEPKIKKVLKDIYNVSPEDSHAFGSFNLGEKIGRLNSFMSGMRFLAVIVGILTLFAGVMAISSILLITVKERTKEFGIRRALGALPGQIRDQIIIESIIITSIAGTLGIIIATGALYLINKFIVPILKASNSRSIPFYNATIDITTLSIAFCIMVFMATLAGLLPAQRAVSIKPIDALREE